MASRSERDIKYGPAQRNLLDVFTTETDSSAQPVLIFVHGGAFAAGDKHSAGVRSTTTSHSGPQDTASSASL